MSTKYDALAHRLFRQCEDIEQSILEAHNIGAVKTVDKLHAINQATRKLLNIVLTRIETIQIAAALELAESPPPPYKVDLTKRNKEKDPMGMKPAKMLPVSAPVASHVDGIPHFTFSPLAPSSQETWRHCAASATAPESGNSGLDTGNNGGDGGFDGGGASGDY